MVQLVPLVYLPLGPGGPGGPSSIAVGRSPVTEESIPLSPLGPLT